MILDGFPGIPLCLKMKLVVKMNFVMKTLLIIGLALTLSSCIPRASEQEDIKKTLNAMWKAIEQEDLETYASYVHPDFTQFGETDSVLRVGKEAELEGIANWLREASEIKTEMLEPKVTIRGDVAWIVYYWKDHGITDTGTFSTRGKSTRIFVRESGKWLCIHGHYTLLP